MTTSSDIAPNAVRPQINQAEGIDYQVTPSFVALLERLGCALVITNYQSTTVMTFSSLGDGWPVQMFAPFEAAMGLALSDDRLAVAARSDVIVLTNIRKLAWSQPKFPGFFDGYFVPPVRYITGECSLRDMVFDAGGIFAVNIAYSCICRIDSIHGFRPGAVRGTYSRARRAGVICGVVAIECATGQVVGTLRDPPKDASKDASERSPSAASPSAADASTSVASRQLGFQVL